MKKYLIKSTAAAVLALSLSSCFEVSETVNLKKDGSGTIVEEIMLGGQVTSMMEGLAGLGGEGAKMPEMFSEEKGKERAEKFGDGVTLEKFEKIEKNGSKGARMTFHFNDINTVSLSLSESTSGLQDMAPRQDAAAANPEKPMTFTYKDGVLTMTNPSAEPDEKQQAEAKKAMAEMKEKMPEGAPTPDAESPEGKQMQAMMMEMMKDMKMSLKINIVDGIAETNATHRDGNTVTLMDMNFGKLMENPDSLKELQALNMQDPSEMQKKLASIDGVKAEMKKTLTIKVK